MSDYWAAAKVYLHADGSRSGSVVYSRDPDGVTISAKPDKSAMAVMEPRCPSGGRACPLLAAAAQAAQAARASANRQRSVRRSVQVLQAYVRGHDLTRLLTFTNGAETPWQSAGDSLDDFMGWLKKDGRRLLGNAPIVAVAERGGEYGRWHIHAAIPKGTWLPYNDIRSSWSEYLTGLGYTSTAASGFHRWHAGDENGKHKKGFANARHAAIYLSKYLRKGLAESVADGRHRYRTLNASAPKPLCFRTDSLTTALYALGVPERGCYRLEYADARTGELHLYGLLFDVGG